MAPYSLGLGLSPEGKGGGRGRLGLFTEGAQG